MFKSVLISLFLLFLFPSTINAQVIINEVYPNPEGEEKGKEWIEIFNTTSDLMSLGGYSIDFGGSNQIKNFCDNDQIGGNSYRLVKLSSNWLKNSDDTITLKNDSSIVDSVSYGTDSVPAPKETQSLSRSPDGDTNWIILDTPTPQGDVANFDCPTPTPSPSPSPTPNPTKTPPPTNTPSPTPSKTPTPKPTIKPTKSPTPTPEEKVLSAETQNSPSPTETPIATPKSTDEGGSFSKLPFIPILFVLGGLVFIGLASLPFLKKWYLKYNERRLQKYENPPENH